MTTDKTDDVASDATVTDKKPKLSPSKSVAALVHVFTGLGAVCAFLATLAVIAKSWEQVFFWLAVAFVVDGLDGPMARALDVGERLKRFSGERLDLVVDYLTYVFVPVLALRFADFLPGTFGLVLCCAILLSSLFHFADVDSKSDTNHFVGFPAVWNIVAFYIFAFAPSASWVGIIVIGFVVLTFVPVHVVHPVRVKDWRAATLAVFVTGGLATINVLWTGLPANTALQLVLVAILLYFIILLTRDQLARSRP